MFIKPCKPPIILVVFNCINCKFVYLYRIMAGCPRARDRIVEPQRILDNAAVVAWNILLMDFVPRISTVEGTIEYLTECGLLTNTFTCPRCNVRCRKMATGGIDRCQRRCPKCRPKKSIRTGSFFSRSHLTLNQLSFIYLWSEDIPLELIQRQTSIQDDGTAMDWANMIRGGMQPGSNGQLS